MIRRFFICLATTLAAAGCMPKDGDDERPAMYVSIAPLRSVVGEIVGEDFNVAVLVPAGASPESFEPSPRQFIALNRAQLVFSVGLIDFERNLLSKLPDASRIVDLSRGIDLITGSCSHNHHGHAHGHGTDPHTWCSPKALKTMAANAYGAINALYPDSAKYKAGYERLLAKLDTLDSRTAAICEAAENRYFIIYHPALTYLARDYGLEQTAIEDEGKEPGAKRMARIIDRARRDNIRRIFYQSQFPVSVVETVAADIGAEAVEIDPLAEDIFGNIEHIARLITE